MAIDQAPYFRMCRDIYKKLGCPKPAVIHSQFLPNLHEPKGKMSSSSNVNATIFLDTKLEDVHKILKKHAFSGAPETLEELKIKGADLTIDVCYKYLTYFMEDDNELNKITKEYSCGKMSTGEIKRITADVICGIIKNTYDNTNKITDEIVNMFFNKNRKFNILSN